jgi:cell division protein ZapA (FtsZ GTPase activity inhibitor)
LSDGQQDEAGATTVTIFGRSYHLRGGGDPDYLTHLAAIVDRKMREVAGATGTADTLKVAILGALNLADDALQGRGTDGARKWTDDDDERVRRMIEILDEALVG